MFWETNFHEQCKIDQNWREIKSRVLEIVLELDAIRNQKITILDLKNSNFLAYFCVTLIKEGPASTYRLVLDSFKHFFQYICFWSSNYWAGLLTFKA